eukprot:3616496-Alexandrium_andersonii.AAC.1
MGMSVVPMDAVKSCSYFEDGMKRPAERIGMKAKQYGLECMVNLIKLKDDHAARGVEAFATHFGNKLERG